MTMPSTPELISRFRIYFKRAQRLKHLILISVILFLFLWKAFWSPDVLFVIFLPVFIFYGLGMDYVKRFFPLVALLFSYESLRSIVPLVNKNVHVHEMINFDKWLFHGNVPTVWLQSHWYHGTLQWYDYYFYFVYMLHFLSPFLIALALWRLRPEGYWRYITALVTLSFAGFATYLLFPAAPPWLASEMGAVRHVTHLSTAIWWGWGIHSIPTLYNSLDPNPVAAVPSLHAAYPTLDFLFVNRLFGKKVSIPFLIYPISVWIGVVYLGEHYVFDVLLGITYAVVAFFATEYVDKRVAQRRQGRVKVPAASSAMPVAASTSKS